MKPFLTLCIFLVCFLSNELSAQPRCGFDRQHKNLEQQQAGYAMKVAENDVQIRQWLAAKQQADKLRMDGRVPNGAETIYEIPVVIHVIHTGGLEGTNYNPSNAQLLGMMDYLNQSFQATWPAYSGNGAGGTRVPFRFVLARRAPDCSPTTGIVRIDGSSVANYATGGIALETATGASQEAVKAISIWPATQYYNVWIVNRIDGKDGYVGTVGPFIAGYAYFPGAGIDIDGTVMLASQARVGASTLPHEMGHAFNLFHTFEGSSGSTCTLNTNCATEGDRVCDTDPTNHEAFFACPLSTDINPCTGNPWNGQQTNFMHYTSCADQTFTPGQRDRMIASVNTVRTGLLSSAGLQPPAAIQTSSAGCVPALITNVDNLSGIGPMRVTLHTLDDSTGSYSHDFQFYQDKTCNMGTSLIEGQEYTLSVSTSYNRQVVKVWIDYNDNGTLETSELVFNSLTPAGHAGNRYTHTIVITAPATAVQDRPLRMRVLADWVDNEFATACTDLLYGQVEDYSVTVLPITALPLKIFDEKLRIVNSAVHFTFKTSEHEAVIRYELQRAANDGGAFQTIREFIPSLEGSSTMEFLVVDESPAGTGWYRIAALEQNGRKYYSKILGMPAFPELHKGSLKLYPNPTAGAFTVNLPLPAGTQVQLVLTDNHGKKIWQGNKTAGQPIAVNEKLAAGIYFLAVTADGFRWNTKLVVTGR